MQSGSETYIYDACAQARPAEWKLIITQNICGIIDAILFVTGSGSFTDVSCMSARYVRANAT